MYLCLCKGLTERDVDRSVGAGQCAGEVAIASLGLDDGGTCGRCPREIRQRGLAAWRGVSEPPEATSESGGVSLVSIALASARGRPGSAPDVAACGVAACGTTVCAACASRSIAAPAAMLRAR